MNEFFWDTETERFGPGKQAPPLVCVSYAHDLAGETRAGLIHWSESEELFEELLYSDDVILVGHNIAYDLAVVAAQFPRFLRPIFEAYEQGRIRDTMIRQKLLDISIGRYRGYRVEKTAKDVAAEAGDSKKSKKSYRWIHHGYSLDDCYFRATRKRLDKDTWRTRYGELRHLPIEEWPEGAREYPIMDAVATREVYRYQEGLDAKIREKFSLIKTHLEDPKPLADEERQCAAAWWLHLIRVWGIRTAADRVYQLTDSVDESYRILEQNLQAAGLVRPTGQRNTKAAKARMIEAMGGKDNCILTDSGEVCLNEDACVGSGDYILMDYAGLSSLKSVKSKDIPALAAGSVLPIHSSFDSLVATGRTSSSKPNIQNIRRLPGIRECFIPRKGKVFLDADYDGLELRTLAQVCLTLVGRSKLAEVLNSGKDPHLQVGAEILNISYAEAERRLAQQDESVDNARQLGKVANFGFPGGLGYESLIYFARKVYRVTLTEYDARKLKAQWLATYPEMSLYFALIDKYCSADVENNTTFIQHLFSKRIRGDIRYTVACNSNFQGLGADATKRAGFLVVKACYVDKDSPLYGCRVVNYIHDQFIVECDEARAHEAAMELARLMVLGASEYLPDVAPTVSKPVVARCWSKKASQVWQNGKLVPWDVEFQVKSKDKRNAA